MTKEFKVGDPVAVYDNCDRIVGKILQEASTGSNLVTVKYLAHGDTVTKNILVHKKQCRHLKPPKPKREKIVFEKVEWNQMTNGGVIYPSIDYRELIPLIGLIGKYTRVTIEILGG